MNLILSAMPALLAIQFQNMGIGDIAIAIVVIAAVVALVYVALRQFGVQLPAWFVHVLWIVICAVVVIVAIKFVMSL
jgi:hypothetical protein